MENFIYQIRARFSAFGQDGVPATKKNGESLLTQKKEPVKGEAKKAENWSWRHFSRQGWHDYDSSDGGEFAAVLAATAFAIMSLEEAEYQNQMKMGEETKTSLAKNKRKRENEPAKLPSASGISRWFMGNEAKDMISPGGEEYKTSRAATNQKLKEAPATVPATKEYHNQHTKSMEFEDTEIIRTSSLSPTSADASITNVDNRSRKRSAPSPRSKESKADLWKQNQMKNIKDWYEKAISSIRSWEDAKKARARRHLERRERGLEKRRARAHECYRMDMIAIGTIAGKAKTAADKRKQNAELKANKEAKQIRLTGNVHGSCFCF